METHERRAEETILEDVLCNRTGIMTHPELSAELIEGTKNTTPSSAGNGEQMASSRADYLNEALPIGSPPLMNDVIQNEPAETLQPAMDSEGVVVLLDKLGERLAFERQGTRLYQAFLQKFEALAEDDELGPKADEIRHICDEELEHFTSLQKAISRLGGDATVQTPSADIAGVLSHGIMQIVSDPRTTIPQSLQALLNAELADNDGWELLRQLAAEVGERELEKECVEALDQEQEHLEKVRGWLLEMTIEEAAGVIAAGAEVEDSDIDDGATQNARTMKKTRGKSKASQASSSKGRKRKKK